MTIRYANLTLKEVTQGEVVEYLSDVLPHAYVSPTINNFVTIYHRVVDLIEQEDIYKLFRLNSHFKQLWKTNHNFYPSQAILVGLGELLSKQFNCAAIGIRVEGEDLWYCLFQDGLMLDEYIAILILVRYKF